MHYTKPEITSPASASFVIQGSTSKAMSTSDGSGADYVTPSAYEADE